MSGRWFFGYAQKLLTWSQKRRKSYVRQSGNSSPLSCYGNFGVQTRSTMLESYAKYITLTALGHHFEFADDDSGFWRGDATNKLPRMKRGWCQACRKHPTRKRFKYAPWTIYRDIFDLIIATLSSKKAMGDQCSKENVARLQYLAQKRVHEWLRRNWIRLKPKARLQRVTQSMYNLTTYPDRSSTAFYAKHP